jgi:hypothetical protein
VVATVVVCGAAAVVVGADVVAAVVVCGAAAVVCGAAAVVCGADVVAAAVVCGAAAVVCGAAAVVVGAEVVAAAVVCGAAAVVCGAAAVVVGADVVAAAVVCGAAAVVCGTAVVVGAAVGGAHTGKPTSPAAHAAQSCAASYRAWQPLHVAPFHMLRQVQLQPLAVSPETAVAWPLQSAATVHSVVGAGVAATQSGKLTRPAAQAPQFWALSKRTLHVPQAAPLHSLRQLQLQPVTTLPLTALAWPLQSAADEHARPQIGYATRPAAHAPHVES